MPFVIKHLRLFCILPFPALFSGIRIALVMAIRTMNANILPIDVLPIPRVTPEGRPSGRSSTKIKDWQQLNSDDQQLVSKTASDNTRTSRHQQPISKEINASDNNARNARQVERTSSDDDFKNVLRRHIEDQQPANEQAEVDDASETQESETNTNFPQIQPAAILQAVITALAGQSEMEQAAPNQTPEAIPSATQNQPVNPGELIEVPENQQQLPQQDLSQQVQTILDTSKNTQAPEQPAILTPAEQVIAPQIPQEGQIPAPQETPADIVNQQVQQNLTPATQDSAETIVRKETSPDTASSDSEVNSQFNNIAAQAVTAESEQSPALPVETIVPQDNLAQPLEPKITKGRRQGGGKSNIDNSKDNSTQDKSDASLDSQTNRLNSDLASNGLPDRLGIEKVELINGKDGSPNSSPVNFAPLISRGALATDASAQIAGNCPIVPDLSKADAPGSAARDVSMSIRQQITQSVQDAAGQAARQISIQLNPPGLGRVSIKFTENGAGLTGRLEATNPQTRAEIQQAIPEILRSLEQSGITVKRIDVSLSDLSRQSNQQSPRDNYSQQLWEHSSNHSFNEQGANHSSYDSFSMSPYSANASQTSVQSSFGYNPQQSSPSDKLLDILV